MAAPMGPLPRLEGRRALCPTRSPLGRRARRSIAATSGREARYKSTSANGRRGRILSGKRRSVPAQVPEDRPKLDGRELGDRLPGSCLVTPRVVPHQAQMHEANLARRAPVRAAGSTSGRPCEDETSWPVTTRLSQMRGPMHIRPATTGDSRGARRTDDRDLSASFFIDYVLPLYGDELFGLHPGSGSGTTRPEVPTLHDPDAGRWIAVAEVDDVLAGYVAWKIGQQANHGEIAMLAVAPGQRRQQVGRALSEHAITEMRALRRRGRGRLHRRGAFHAPARGAVREPRLHQGADRRVHQEGLIRLGPA